MNRKPSRTFVSLALILVFLLVIGLVVVGVLASNNRPLSSFELTRNSIVSNNIVNDGNPLATETVKAATKQTETEKAAFTPIYYDASMSPTVTVTRRILVSPTATPPYNAELYEKRRMEELGLNTSGGPTQYAIFYATETALVAAYQTAMHFTPTPTATVSMTPSPNVYGFNAQLSEAGQTAVWILMTAGGPDEYATFYAAEAAYQTQQAFVGTPTSSPTAFPTQHTDTSYPRQCAYSWAHRDLPDVAILAQNALESAGIANAIVHADAYGEECIDFSTNTVVSFGAMTTDFYVTAQLLNVNATNTLADYVVDVYAILTDLDQDSLPARLGYLDFTFIAGTTKKYLRTTFDDIQAALDKKLAGQQFLDAVGGLR